ncbi:HTH-type transcriptional regulator MalT [Paraburkholderia kirstenboschensis]|uniref:LuxR C-terminal-related transcriptional regulator n=1 Tax=Paraburkholderia kirstenboschensis TaxID=1245436 RepID=UPI0019198E40|nr:LuxR C-terminal-related transcriptional regulator [Paraburkholderia kirstenboschensis]CAD6551168.1 HTH-type transcriptional regulator MalT [Paraburkholderia kirstenboschensis]
MPFPKLLIETRFAPPRIGAQHVARADLLAQLAQVQQRKLALITGSAGYGKTTLLAQWRQRCMQDNARVAWLSLTTDDKGFADFCFAFFAALQNLGVAVELALPVDRVSAASIDETVSSILSAIEPLTDELYLILDDYHHVEDPGAHRLIQRLIERCPANLHLLIASRAVPPLGLSRLRVMDQMVELDSAKLPFSSAETRSFLEGNLGPGQLSADDTGMIHDLTGGWPSCLQLIVIMLRNRPGARNQLSDLVWRSNDLQTWLSEEVIATLPPDLVAFCEDMSLFRRFNAPLAAFVTGHPNAADLLARMELENLPLQRVDLDDELPWFRFHRLFGEFLDTRVQRRGAAALAQLHQRASQWFARHKLVTEAVRHANLAGDVELAAQVIEQAGPATWTLGYVGPLLQLLERLPHETLLEHPHLAELMCLAISLTALPAQAEAQLDRLGVNDPARWPSAARSLPLVRAVIALQRDDTQQTICLLESHRVDTADNPFLRYLMLSVLSVAYAGSGRYADARALLESQPVPAADRNNDMTIIAESTHALALLLEGDAREAARIAATLHARALKRFGERSVCANVCAAFLADALYELNQTDDARETLANRHGLLESSGVEVTVRASLCRARLDLLQEGAGAALTFLRQQAARFRGLGYDRPFALMLAEQIRIHVNRGNRAETDALLQTLDTLAAQHEHSQGFLVEVRIAAALSHARVDLSTNPQRARKALETARQHALSIGRGRLLTLIDLLSARAFASLGRADEAMALRSRAVQCGCRYGLTRTFLDEGALARDELALVVQAQVLHGPALQFAQGLLATYPAGTTTGHLAPLPRKASGARNGHATLTQREIQVLGLVAQAMSNKRIALALDITVETVKWNLRNIFSKLGVSRRYDAMVWARNQKLID